MRNQYITSILRRKHLTKEVLYLDICFVEYIQQLLYVFLMKLVGLV